MTDLADVALRDQVQEALEEMIAEQMSQAPGGRNIHISVRLPLAALEFLQTAAKANDWSVSQILRQAVGQWIRQYRRTRRAALRRVSGLAEGLAAQAQELFRELPDNEIGDEEPLKFAADPAGSIIIHVDRTDMQYRLFEGHAVRLRPVDEGRAEMVLFRAGKAVETAEFELAALGAWLESKEATDARSREP